MTCKNPLEETNKQKADNLKNLTQDTITSLAVDSVKEVFGHRYARLLELSVSSAKVAKNIAEEAKAGKGDPNSHGYTDFGHAEIEVGERISKVADVLAVAAVVATVIPGAQPAAVVLEGASFGLSIAAVGFKQLGAAYVDTHPGRDPTCPPPETFPSDNFLNPPASPLVLDLDGNGFDFTALVGSTVHFDFQHDGFRERTGWLGGGDGFLVLDANDNGKIDDGHELFGSNTTNGFDILAFYDGRVGGDYWANSQGGTIDQAFADGIIDQNDAIFSRLQIWRDLDQNGLTDAGELFGLAQYGVTSFDLNYQPTEQHYDGNTVLQVSHAGAAGGPVDMADVWFAVDRTNTVFGAGASVDPYLGAPDLHGYGSLKSLHLAMQDDAEFGVDVIAFVDRADALAPADLLAQFEDLLFEWAGVENIDPTGRGEYVDARILAFMERAHDQVYHQFEGVNAGTSDPGPNASAKITQDFHAAAGKILIKFLAQVTSYHVDQWLASPDPWAIDFVATKFDVLFGSLLTNGADDGLFFSGDQFAAWFVDLDLSDAKAVKDAMDVLALVPLIESALGAPAAEFESSLKDAFLSNGAGFMVALLDNVSSVDMLGGVDTAHNGVADFVDGASGQYLVVGHGETVAADLEHNNVYFISHQAGAVTIQADLGVDRILLDAAFDEATYSVAYDAGSGDVTLNFDALGVSITLAGYLGAGQLTSNALYDERTGEVWTPGAIVGDEILFHNGTHLTALDIWGLVSPKGDAADNQLIGGELRDVLLGQDGDDRLEGWGGDDRLGGGNGDDVLIGYAGDDRFEGGRGDDVYGVANSAMGGVEYAGADTYVYRAGDGHDVIYDATLVYPRGVDAHGELIYAAAEANILELADTDAAGVVLSRSGNALSITFLASAGDSIVVVDEFTTRGISYIVFGDGAVWDYAAIQSHTARSSVTAGNDTIVGFDGGDELSGGLGDDSLQGSPTNFGAADTFVYTAGDGNDTIIANYEGSRDTLVLQGISAADVTVSRNGVDALLSFNIAAGGSITLSGQFDALNWTDIETIRFADGAVWGQADLAYRAAAAITTPTVSGDSGDNVVSGTSSADGLAGGGGVDVLAGGLGADTYFVGAGDGQTTIVEQGRSDYVEADVVRLGVTSGQVQVERSGNDVLLTLQGGDSVRLAHFFNDNSSTHNSAEGVEMLVFADGETWSVGDITTHALFRGGTGNDQVHGTYGADRLWGGDGDDVLTGDLGSDTYVFLGGQGDDTVVEDYGGGGADRIVLADATLAQVGVERIFDMSGDWLVLRRLDGGGSIEFGADGWGVEFIEFADGTTVTPTQLRAQAVFAGGAGDDYVRGSMDADILRGGKGVDDLWGTDGGDSYLWSRYDGDDVIQDYANGFGGVDVLKLVDIDPSSVRLERTPTQNPMFGMLYDLKVIIQPLNQGDRAETITVVGQYGATSASWNGVEQIQFSDGTIWNTIEIAKRAALTGTNGDDTLLGSRYADTLEGGLGDDVLDGGLGIDTYVWRPGDGNDRITSDYFSEGYADKSFNVLALRGVQVDDVRLDQEGYDVIVAILSTGEHIRIDGLQPDGYGVGRIVFDDGSNWDLAQIRARATIRGDSGDDALTGTRIGDRFEGGGGDDYLSGGGGSDLYVYHSGDGNDVIGDISGVMEGDDDGDYTDDVDVLSLADLARADVSLDYDNGHLLVSVLTTGETIRVLGQLRGGLQEGSPEALAGVERIIFADGVLDGRQAIREAAGAPLHLVGTELADVLIGGRADDVFEPGRGADEIRAGAGHDLVIGFEGDGDDLIDGGDGADAVDYSAITGPLGVDLSTGVVTGAAGVDSLVSIESVWTGDGDDLLTGSVADNRLISGAGDDRLDGGQGADVLAGDAGSDTYVYRLGDGEDQINDQGLSPGGGDVDVLQLVDLNMADVTLNAGDGGDLVVRINATGETIVVSQQFYGGEPGSAEAAYGLEKIIFADGTLESRVAISVAAGLENYVYGTPANDVLQGSAGVDVFSPDLGDDVVHGLAGNDRIFASQDDGDDLFDGGDGRDLVDYAAVSGDLTVDLTAGIASGAAGDDILIAIEDVSGGAADDHLSGSNGANMLLGQDGDDVLAGGGGDDVLDGGEGFDTVSYGLAVTGVNLDLRLQGLSQDSAEGLDTLISIEAVVGSAHDDVLTGDLAANHLQGGSGDDVLNAYGVADVLLGGEGADVLNGAPAGSLPADAPDITKAQSTNNVDLTRAVTLDGAFDDGVFEEEITDSASLPHATVQAVASGAGAEYYAFSAAAASRLVIDIDHADFDTIVELLDAEGNVVASNDDSDGDPGSLSANSYLDTVIDQAGAYFVRVSRYDFDGVPEAGQAYTLHLSLAGADTSAAPVDGSIRSMLDGGAGGDRLIGGMGDETLAGGSGDDVFVIGADGGLDTITDFKIGGDLDIVAFQAGLFADFTDLLAHSQQVGDDVLITLSASDAVLLQSIALGDLASGDFLFAA